ncbi:hypothetical protein KP78_01660 [Jeotgalibacillus soli]|uniref:Uncharacterized protein n=1 Tax=Jeotgalibacillus soli TaxID=889306 RepID=A0A0C2W5D4_9BACL|nr:hypothetical protein KP78_01660 [Jeotgalibacillus soli]
MEQARTKTIVFPMDQRAIKWKEIVRQNEKRCLFTTFRCVNCLYFDQVDA